jgi:hypothetical protein
MEGIIAGNGTVTQRQISLHAGMSLGLTNLILKRLARTGYIKVSQLTPKKISYILTRKGLEEKAKKSYHYVIKVVKQMSEIKKNIQNILINEYNAGNTKIGVIGNNEFAGMIKAFALELPQVEIILLEDEIKKELNKKIQLIINCGDSQEKDLRRLGIKTINLLEYMVNPVRMV